MEFSFLNTIGDMLNQTGKFLFESYFGVFVLIGLIIFISLIVAIILEVKTHNKFQNNPIEDKDFENDSNEE